MADDKRVYSGQLLLPPVGKLLLKKTWQQKFCLLYRASKFGKERLEIFDSIDDANNNMKGRIMTLENCIKITQKGQTSFVLHMRNTTYEFGTLSAQSCAEWMTAFQSVIFPDDVSRVTSILEDNDLYCSYGEGVFAVKLLPSDATRRCGLEPINYTLVLTATAIQLRAYDNKLLFTWPYCYIRRYGYKDGKFTFEAGRKCESGEGTFFLEHSNHNEIYRCLSSKMQSMKKLLKGESHPSVPALLEVGDNQLHAALSMEARTRSPLPPSPTTSTTLHDIEAQFSTKSDQSSQRYHQQSSKKHTDLILGLGSHLTQKSHAVQKSPKPNKNLNRPIPAKPPRKNLVGKNTDNDNNNFHNAKDDHQDYEAVQQMKYDEVQVIQNAWKTLGTDEMHHTENQNSDEEEVYMSWGHRPNFPDENLPKASKVITESYTGPEEGYDKLDYFGSSSKVNAAKSGYKQVIPPPVNIVACPPSFNVYDEVGTVFEGVRKADDSHLGYAQVRKATKDNVNHKVFNNDSYAIISKPKRV